jgi:hypothetical protein
LGRFWLHKINLARVPRPFLPLSSPTLVNSSMISLLGIYPYQALAALFCGYILYTQLKKDKSNPKGLPLPPGPKGYPLIGNLFDLPVNKAWLVYAEWSKIYGGPFVIKRLVKQYILITGHSR